MSHNITSRSFLLSWSPPEGEKINGILRNYHLSVSQHKSSVIEDVKVPSSVLWYGLKELTPFTTYDCSLSGITTDVGPAAIIVIKTAEDGK